MSETQPRVRISAAANAAMREHARNGYPLEICGFLVGTDRPEGRNVLHAWPVENAWDEHAEQRRETFEALEGSGAPASKDQWEAHSQERRFYISPAETAAALKRARSQRLDLIGVYHTHPNHPAEPSVFDLSMAAPEWSYVILSVRAEGVSELRSWVLPWGAEAFIEEVVESGEA